MKQNFPSDRFKNIHVYYGHRPEAKWKSCVVAVRGCFDIRQVSCIKTCFASFSKIIDNLR